MLPIRCIPTRSDVLRMQKAEERQAVRYGKAYYLQGASDSTWDFFFKEEYQSLDETDSSSEDSEGGELVPWKSRPPTYRGSKVPYHNSIQLYYILTCS